MRFAAISDFPKISSLTNVAEVLAFIADRIAFKISITDGTPCIGLNKSIDHVLGLFSDKRISISKICCEKIEWNELPFYFALNQLSLFLSRGT